MSESNRVERDLSTLSKAAQLLFGVLTAERLFPNYVEFEQRSEWGNSIILRQCMDMTYVSLFDPNSYTLNELERKIDELNAVIPDTTDFPNSLAPYALDASVCVLNGLNFIQKNDIECISEISSLAYDTVDRFIIKSLNLDVQDRFLQSKIDGNDLMMREKLRQNSLIVELRKLTTVDDATVGRLINPNPIVNLKLLP